LGNNPGDTAVSVQIPTLGGAGGMATITYQTQVNMLMPGTAATLPNQGGVSGGNFAPTPTDDPNQPGTSDPTVVLAVGAAPAPALGSLGMFLFVAVLAGVAALSLRRAAADRLRK
jgi:hypothetical protein